MGRPRAAVKIYSKIVLIGKIWRKNLDLCKNPVTGKDPGDRINPDLITS
ncbi:MAG TPA: hypothetical protein VGM24_04835 [Puia sp.]|jgi:hypothetical protein